MGTLTKSPQRIKASAIQPRGYVELLARSNFSFLQGASHPEEMVEQAILHEYDGIAICDLNGLYGVARGYQVTNSPSLFGASLKAKDHFKYILGAELTLTDATHLVLIPQNRQGYSRLCELLTFGKRQAEKGFSKLSLDDIESNSDDLIAFAIPPWHEDHYQRLHKIFGDRLYLPIWKDLTWESQEFCAVAYELEDKWGAQLFVTQRAFMHSPKRKPLFDVLTCIHHHTTLTEAKDILSQNAERYLRPLHDLAWLWQDRIDLIEATLDIAEKINFSLDEIRYRYPESHLPPGISKTTHLKNLVVLGLKNRYSQTASKDNKVQIPQKVTEAAEHELSIIRDLEYEDYFLTLYEICEFARSKQILFQGRGSAANSVVCFALGLTSVDPTKIDLLFERFISKERGEPPDIDIDFEHSRREEVIQHIYEKYDENHAAMVCTVIRFKSRMSIRETAKVFAIPLKTINAIIKFTGRDGMRRLLSHDEESLKSIAKFGVPEKTWTLFIDLAQQLHGFPRHIGIHTGGFLITHDRITEMVPVEKATMNGRYVIQWNKDDVNNLKLMKIDFLSLGMLTALRKCLELLKQHRGIDWNLAQIPPEDPKTYDMICKADTVGVFQIESRAQMNTLPRLKPRNFYDLVVEVAIVRPGPLQGGMVHPYLKRRQGLEPVTYPHPDLIPILSKTKGVSIFQEQVMRIVVVAAGFTPGEADELRRIMSSAWRKRVTMETVRTRILSGLLNHGLTKEYAEQVYKTIEGFANYGFPESHAASFALLTYASSYIKCHFPEVFACALLNSQPMGFYHPRNLIADAQHHGVQVLPLDINKSDYDYTLEDNKNLRVGLRSLYGMPEKHLHNLLENRDQHGEFQSLEEFVRRCPLPRTILMKLAASGALQGFGYDPRELLWRVESLSLDPNSFSWGGPKESHQQELEDEDTAQNAVPFESNWDALQREYASKGFSVDNHPLSVMRSWLEQKNETLIRQRYVPYFASKDLGRLKHKVKVRIAGLVGITQRPPTAKGMCFITLEDEFGFINIVVPPDVYQKYRLTIYSKSLLEIQGFVEQSPAITNIKAEKILPLQ